MLKNISNLGSVLNKSEQKLISGGKRVISIGNTCDNGTTCSTDGECPKSCTCDFHTSHGYKICG